MNAAPPVDPETIAELRCLLSADARGGWERFVSEFLDGAQSCLRALRQAAASRDLEEVRRAAHALKGSSGNLSAARLAELCRRLEDAARSGDCAELLRLGAQAESELSRVRGALEPRP